MPASSSKPRAEKASRQRNVSPKATIRAHGKPSGARHEARISTAFARHETFHPRYGWLKKGVDVASRDPAVFVRDEASVKLGVGKNMVRAIRYWCHATKVLVDAPGARGGGSVPSAFGSQLIGTKGIDPYLENLGSLWLLHWRLLEPPCLATAWHFAFSVFSRVEFTLDELSAALMEYVMREFATARFASSSLRKDVSCIVRMYADSAPIAAVGEDSIQCPFVELGLVRSTGPKTFAFNLGAKAGLSSWLIAAAALQFVARSDSNARTVSFSTLLHSAGSPGLVFKLTESALYSALEEAVLGDRALALTDAAGLIQLSFTDQPLDIVERLLRRHYGVTGKRKAIA